ncbi:MAG: hypothetical protein ABIH92_04450 [Nanoarchaeota archaeon]
MKRMFEARFWDSGTDLRGEVVQDFEIPGQGRRAILLEDCEPSNADLFAYLHEGNTVLDIGALRGHYERAYDQIARKEDLPPDRNLFHLPTFRAHFRNHGEFDERFWSLIEKVYEIERLHSLPERDRRTVFVNSWVDAAVAYYIVVKHPAEFDVLAGKGGIGKALGRYFGATARQEDYSGLVFSDMDRSKGGPLMPVVSDFFWRGWSEEGYDKRRIFLAEPGELAGVAKRLAEKKYGCYFC